MGSIISTASAIIGKKSRRVLMVGPSGAGKTTILYRLKLGKVVPTFATVGANVETIEYKDISFTIHDVRPGIHATTMYCNLFLEDTDAVILVFDSNDRITDDYEIRHLMNYFRRFPLLILANKQDLPNSMTIAEISQRWVLELDPSSNKRWFIQGTSATQGTGLNEALDWLSRELYIYCR